MHYETPAKNLLVNPGTGEVMGLIAKHANRHTRVRANRAVILASGSYSDNPELLQHFGGSAVEGDLYGGQRIVALVGHGLEIAGDSAVGLGVAEGSEAPGDLLLDLGHTDIALGAVIGERGIGVAGEAQHLGFVLDQHLVE